MLLSGTHYQSHGNHRLLLPGIRHSETNNGIAEDMDKGKFDQPLRQIFPSRLHPGKRLCSSGKKGLLPPLTGRYSTNLATRGRIRQGFVRLGYDHHFGNQLDVHAAASYNLSHIDGDYVYDYSDNATPFLVVNKDRFRGEWWGAELQLTKRLWQRHKLILGGEFQDNFRQDQTNYDLVTYLNAQHSSRNWGAYLQDEFQVFDNLILNLGVRYDHYDTFGGTVNPRLALIYNPFEKTTLKLLYGRAFRAPSAFEGYYNDGFQTQKPNPNLHPERITTYELVWEQYLGDHLRSVASAFHYEINDLINLTLDPTDGLLVFRNMDKVRANGVELELNGKWRCGLEGRVSYSLQEASDEKTDELLTNSPKHLVKGNLIVPLLRERLFLSLEEQYTSERKTVSGNEAGGYAVTNLTLFGHHFLKGLELSASVYNLFDKKFSDPASEALLQDTIQQDGRNFRFKLTYAF